jgi:phage tail tape-measure protein
MEKITMSQKEIKAYRLGMDVIEGKLTIVDYALQIGKSYRQAQRIINKIKKKDAQGVLHGNTGREENHTIKLR